MAAYLSIEPDGTTLASYYATRLRLVGHRAQVGNSNVRIRSRCVALGQPKVYDIQGDRRGGSINQADIYTR